MRDALNATGRPIYYSITGIVGYDDRQPAMHCSPQTAPGPAENARPPRRRHRHASAAT